MGSTWADRLLRPRSVGIPVAVVVAILLFPPVFSVVKTPTIAFQEELPSIVTSEGELTVDWYPSSEDRTEIVIRRWPGDGTAVELGRGMTYPADVNDAHVYTNNDFVMVCGPVNGPDSRRYVFGAVTSRVGLFPRPPIEIVAYEGPPAVGARIVNGLYLIVLDPGEIDLDEPMVLRRTDGYSSQTGRAFEDAVEYGTLQPSGCHVA